MLRRLPFLLIAAFFLVMNVLLWRAEIIGHSDLGSPIPIQQVWHRILTAPDDSALEITLGTEKIGYCRWVPNADQDAATGRTANEDYEPESFNEMLSAYTIDLEGNILLGEHRVRYTLRLECGTNNTWRTFNLGLNVRPFKAEIHATAAGGKVRISLQDGGEKLEQEFRFDELRDPKLIAARLGNPALPALLAPLMAGLGRTEPAPTTGESLPWRATTDWLPIGHTKMRVYRLEARILDRHRFVAITSRVGEILRVELPGGIVLQNDALLLL
jgi:hypothetical protein